MMNKNMNIISDRKIRDELINYATFQNRRFNEVGVPLGNKYLPELIERTGYWAIGHMGDISPVVERRKDVAYCTGLCYPGSMETIETARKNPDLAHIQQIKCLKNMAGDNRVIVCLPDSIYESVLGQDGREDIIDIQDESTEKLTRLVKKEIPHAEIIMSSDYREELEVLGREAKATRERLYDEQGLKKDRGYEKSSRAEHLNMVSAMIILPTRHLGAEKACWALYPSELNNTLTAIKSQGGERISMYPYISLPGLRGHMWIRMYYHKPLEKLYIGETDEEIKVKLDGTDNQRVELIQALIPDCDGENSREGITNYIGDVREKLMRGM